MASSIAAITTGSGGIVSTGDSSGNLNLVSGTTTIVAVSSSGAAITGTASVSGATTLSSTLAVSGVSTFAAGTALLPALTTTGDTDTGVWFPAADTVATSTGGTERMRIDSNGNLMVGTTSASATFMCLGTGNQTSANFYNSGSLVGTSALVVRKGANDASTSQKYIEFLYNSGTSGNGQINGNGGSQAAFGSYSDVRLKENIINLPSQLANIMALRPVEFDYIGYEHGKGHQIGFIAQEVQAIYPDLVGEATDGMLTLTDMNKNDARLIKAIQELKAIIDTQAAQITALNAKVGI